MASPAGFAVALMHERARQLEELQKKKAEDHPTTSKETTVFREHTGETPPTVTRRLAKAPSSPPTPQANFFQALIDFAKKPKS